MTLTPEPCFLSDYIIRLDELHDQGKLGVIAHMLPLVDRLAVEYWLTDDETSFLVALKNDIVRLD